MIIVSDSSPLHDLIAIGQVEILRALFGSIVVPGVVVSELTHAKAPEAVRSWMLKPPDWLTVRDPVQIDRSLPRLDDFGAPADEIARLRGKTRPTG